MWAKHTTNNTTQVLRLAHNVNFTSVDDLCLAMSEDRIGAGYGPVQFRIDAFHVSDAILPHLTPGRLLLYRPHYRVGDLQFDEDFQMQPIAPYIKWVVALFEADGVTEVLINGLPVWQFNSFGESRLRRLTLVRGCGESE